MRFDRRTSHRQEARVTDDQLGECHSTSIRASSTEHRAWVTTGRPFQRPVLKEVQSRCRVCSGVVAVEMKATLNMVQLSVKGGWIQDHSGQVAIHCTRCLRAVAVLSLREAA